MYFPLLMSGHIGPPNWLKLGPSSKCLR